MSLIDKITGLSVKVFKSQPPQFDFTVMGEITGGQFCQATLSRIKHAKPPADLLEEFHIHAAGEQMPKGSGPIKVTLKTSPLSLSDWAKGAKFVAAVNTEEWVPWPWSIKAGFSLDKTELLSSALLGRKFRDVAYGSMATLELSPGRVTLWRNEHNHIDSIRIDPEKRDGTVPGLNELNEILHRRKLRVVPFGDTTLPVIEPGRVTIWLTSDARIQCISLDPDLAMQ